MTKTFTFNDVEGLNWALRKLPKEATVHMRDASVKIAQEIADRAATEAYAEGGVAKLVAPSIRASRDRVPVVKMGNSRRLPPRNGRPRKGDRQTIGDVMWGAEFGGGRRSTTRQFQPWRGNSTGAGYFLWPTVRDSSEEVMIEYGDALLDAIDAAAKGAH